MACETRRQTISFVASQSLGRTGWLSSHKSLSDFKWAPAVFIQRRHDLCHKASVDTVDASCGWSPRSHQDQIQIRTTLTPSSVTGFTHTEERFNVSQHSNISRRYQSSEGRVSRKQGNDAFGFSGRQFLPQVRFYNPYRSDDQGNVTNRGKYTLLTLTLVP